MGKPVVEGSLESPPFEKPSIEQVKSQNVGFVAVWWVFLLLLLFTCIFLNFILVGVWKLYLFWDFLQFVFLFVNVSTGFENRAFFRHFEDVSVFCLGQRGLQETAVGSPFSVCTIVTLFDFSSLVLCFNETDFFVGLEN